MISPRELLALFQTCDDSRWIGDVCRALGGQAVALDATQRRALRKLARATATRKRRARTCAECAPR